MSGRPFVATAWGVDEWNHVRNKRNGPLAVGGGNWFTPANDVAAIPFEVVGEDASIEVAPGDLSVVDETGATVVDVEYDEQPPEAVSRFLSERDVPPPREPPWDNYDMGNRVQGDRKYVEAAIEPGDDVYVHGRARERSDGSLVLENREDVEHELVVSRHRKPRTVRTLTRSDRVALAGWLGAAVGGLTLAATLLVEVAL